MKNIKTIVKLVLRFSRLPDLFFLTESKAISKSVLAPRNGKPSIFFFTTYKCASTFTPKILAYAARQLDLKPVDYARLLWHKTNEDAFYDVHQHAKKLFQPTGYVFAPLREWINAPACEDSKVIIMLRDPRDVLVSMYYSTAYTHSLPANKIDRTAFLDKRAQTIAMSIDAFALSQAPRLYSVYSQYFAMLSSHKNYYFCTYEQMILDFQDWIAGFENYLGIDVDAKTKQRWQLQVTPPQEEHLAHKRQMLPGDYKQKLRPETIQKLDSIFSEFLDSFRSAVH